MKRNYDKGEQILTAAYEIFGKKGFHAAKMDDIALEAGVAKGTLYLYYDNKAELFHAVIEKILQDYLHAYERIINEERPFQQKLALLVRHHLLFIRDRHDFAKINMQEGSFTDETRKKLVECAQKVSGLFVRFVQESYPSAVNEQDAFLSYLCFSGMGDGIVSDLFWGQRDFTDEQVEERARFVANLFMNGLQHIQPVQSHPNADRNHS